MPHVRVQAGRLWLQASASLRTTAITSQGTPDAAWMRSAVSHASAHAWLRARSWAGSSARDARWAPWLPFDDVVVVVVVRTMPSRSSSTRDVGCWTWTWPCGAASGSDSSRLVSDEASCTYRRCRWSAARGSSEPCTDGRCGRGRGSGRSDSGAITSTAASQLPVPCCGCWRCCWRCCGTTAGSRRISASDRCCCSCCCL
ncbi:hypothetical protein BC831DRAFT_482681, partial [Entophlyctis helioformis]